MTAPDASALSHLQPSAVEKTPRIEWVDAAKGIGIILVVIGHAIVGKAISNVFAYLGIKTLPIDFIHVMFVAGRRIALNKILRVDNLYAILFLPR